jgi:hypothetical protein
LADSRLSIGLSVSEYSFSICTAKAAIKNWKRYQCSALIDSFENAWDIF